MICTHCNQDAEHKVFSSFSYYYCHQCKDEVRLEEVGSSRIHDGNRADSPWARIPQVGDRIRCKNKWLGDPLATITDIYPGGVTVLFDDGFIGYVVPEDLEVILP